MIIIYEDAFKNFSRVAGIRHDLVAVLIIFWPVSPNELNKNNIHLQNWA